MPPRLPVYNSLFFADVLVDQFPFKIGKSGLVQAVSIILLLLQVTDKVRNEQKKISAIDF